MGCVDPSAEEGVGSAWVLKKDAVSFVTETTRKAGGPGTGRSRFGASGHRLSHPTLQQQSQQSQQSHGSGAGRISGVELRIGEDGAIRPKRSSRSLREATKETSAHVRQWISSGDGGTSDEAFFSGAVGESFRQASLQGTAVRTESAIFPRDSVKATPASSSTDGRRQRILRGQEERVVSAPSRTLRASECKTETQHEEQEGEEEAMEESLSGKPFLSSSASRTVRGNNRPTLGRGVSLRRGVRFSTVSGSATTRRDTARQGENGRSTRSLVCKNNSTKRLSNSLRKPETGLED